MDRPCDVCGQTYDAKRPNSKYCGDTCRKRASRGHVTDSDADLVALPVSAREIERGPVESALFAELAVAERDKTTLGQAALSLARRVDVGRDTGAGLASLVKQLEATAKAATADVKSAASPLDKARDQLAERRAKRGA
jgi:hypothetical protein